MSKKTTIVVIDSGFNHHPELKGINIKNCYEFLDDGQVIENTNNCTDISGHGTAILSILYKYAPSADYIIFKIFDDDNACSEEKLLCALNYIYEHIDCNYINLSCGIASLNNYEKAFCICKNLTDKGIIIVSAFSNDGLISYPAAFDFIIGVDISSTIFKPNEFYYVENSPIDIRGFAYSQHLPTTGSNYGYLSGTSFVVPHILGLLYEKFYDTKPSIHECKLFLKELSIRTLISHKDVNETNQSKVFPIKKAIIFPFNKENENLLRYNKDLDFEIIGLAETRYNINRIKKELSDKSIDPPPIYCIETFDWNTDFDTLIIGHTNMIEAALKKPIKNQLLDLSLQHNKNVFLFDDINFDINYIEKFRKKGLYIYIPYVNSCGINTFGKLNVISSPVVGIFGTGPKQGKFSIQLALKKHMESMEYKIEALGTEPYAPLFKFNAVYPIGYNSTVSISGKEAIQYINHQVSLLDHLDPDLILIGSQSQTIPTGDGNIALYPISQHELILGSQPDAYLLCVYCNEDLEYICRNVNYLHSINNAMVIAIIIFPFLYEINNGIVLNKKTIVEQSFLNLKKTQIEEFTKIKTFIFMEEKMLDTIVSLIQEYFS